MHLLVVEDDSRLRSYLEKGLSEAGYTVTSCADGIDGLLAASGSSFEAAVIDIMLPKLDGLSLIEKIREQGINTPVLILSAKQSVDDRIAGLQRGGDDYLVKPFSFAELLARLQALIRRGTKSTESTKLSYHDIRIDLLKHEVYRDNDQIELPTKEYRLLEYMLRNPERVLSKTSILEQVYGYNFDPQTNVVDVLVCRLRNKVDKDFKVKLIHTVRGMGYVLRIS
ncbi:MAG: response regulator transcription factor [Thermodesulfobacteriota bacterium]